MSIFSWAFKSNAELGNSEIQSLFSLGISCEEFVKADMLQTYVKILTDVAERTHGLKDEQEPLLWDSAVQTNANEGLITLLAGAMVEKSELFLVYAQSVKVIRKATAAEETEIRADYKAKGESGTGVFISFKNYWRSDLLKLYSSLEHAVLASLNKTVNVAKSIQLKISDLRSSVSLNDSGIAREQAKSIAQAMRNGNDILIDAKDSVETAKPDTAPTEKAISFLDSKRAFVLGLPLAYVVGEQTGGIGATGEADMRAVERGLRQYFVSIIRPVFEVIFDEDVEFKTQDFRQITSALEVLKMFDLTSEQNLSSKTKQNITARVFDVDPEKEAKLIEEDAKAAELEKKNNPPPAPITPPAQAKPGETTGGQGNAGTGV